MEEGHGGESITDIQNYLSSFNKNIQHESTQVSQGNYFFSLVVSFNIII